MAYQHKTAYPSHSDNNRTLAQVSAHVAPKIKDVNPHSVYVHGINHGTILGRTQNNADTE